MNKKCKNIECDNFVSDKRIYCSRTCRNIYVNKYLRDYSKISKTLSNNFKEQYNLNPKYCKNPNCQEKISYNKRENNFCNSSCSASYNNQFRKGIKYNLTEEGKKSLIKTAKNNFKLKLFFNEKKEKYYKNPKTCLNCKGNISYKQSLENRIYCSRICSQEHRRKHLNEFQKYKSKAKFNFNLFGYPDEFNFDLIKKYGWYKPSNKGNNLNGVSRDHIYSISEGFKNNVDPYLISHPANCKLILHSNNSSKHSRSDITIEELQRKVKEWDEKYKNN